MAGRAAEPGERTPDDLIDAATTRPWPGRNYPALPSLSTELRYLVTREILGSTEVRQAYEMLEAKERLNVDWFEGIRRLEEQRAVWSILSCLCHPSEDVQVNALRSLERLGDPRAVPFLLIYAEYMAVFEEGSENATIHGTIHESIAETLSALTGVQVHLERQDPEGLKDGIVLWRKWALDHPGETNPMNISAKPSGGGNQ